jgi:predicted kinase
MTQKPTLILISGPPGAGKSTLSRSLAARLHATHLDKDCIDEPFSPGDRGPRYTRQIEPKVLAGVLALAELNLRPNHVVLIDIPWTHILYQTPAWRTRIRKLARARRARLIVLELVLPPEVLRARLKNRGLSRDRIKLTRKGWERFARTDRITEKNPLPHQELDATLSRANLLRRALRAIHLLT